MSLYSKIRRYESELAQHDRRIRRFSTDSIVANCTRCMRWVGMDIEKMTRYPHHELYYLMKRSIVLGKMQPQKQSVCSDVDFNILLRQQLSIVSPLVDIIKANGDSVNMLMKLTAQFCQFPFQEKPGNPAVSRSVYLFKQDKEKFDYEKSFNAITGISLDMYLHGCLLAYSFAQQGIVLPRAISGSSLPITETHNWQRFLGIIGADYPMVREWIDENDLKTQLFSMYCSPFLERYPVLRTDVGENIVLWPNFLLHSMCYGPYYILKESSPERFPDQFGKTFQAYVGRLLESMKEFANQEYFEEQQFSKGDGKKTPDFALFNPETNALICIEVKATEEKLRLNEALLIKETQAQIGNAVKQCHDLWARSLSGEEALLPGNIETCIPIVVTHKQFQFHNSRKYRDDVVLPLREERDQETFSHCVDSFQAVSIDVFENIVRHCIATKKSLAEVFIRKVKTCPDDSPASFVGTLVEEENAQGGFELYGIPGVTESLDCVFDELMNSIDESHIPELNNSIELAHFRRQG